MKRSFFGWKKRHDCVQETNVETRTRNRHRTQHVNLHQLTWDLGMFLPCQFMISASSKYNFEMRTTIVLD